MSDSGPTVRYFNDLERAYDDPGRIGWFAEFLRDCGPEYLVIDGGDSTALGGLSVEGDDRKEHALPFFDAVSPDVHVPGNHDFDNGGERLASVQAETTGRWIASNVSGGVTDFGSTAVFQRAGRSIGVVGVAHPDTVRMARITQKHTTSSAHLSPDLTVTNPIATLQEGLAVLHNRGVDYTIAISHCGSIDEKLASETTVDFILGGHDHRRVVREIDDTVVARTEGQGRAAIELHLNERDVQIHEPEAVDPGRNEVARIYQDRLRNADLSGEVTTFSNDLDSGAVRDMAVRALREETGSDIAVIPKLAVRGDLSGETTKAELIGVVPFRLPTATVPVSEDTIRDVLARADATSSAFAETVWSGANPKSRAIDADPAAGDTYRLALVQGLFNSDIFEGVSRGQASEHCLLHRQLVRFASNADRCRI